MDKKSFEKLHKAVTKVKNLLDDPQFGVFSWNEMLVTALLENQKALSALANKGKEIVDVDARNS